MIDGKALGWTNCTPASIAMGISKATAHAKNPDDCTLRRMTGDTSGGTRLSQYESIAAKFGVVLEVRNGGNACTPAYAAGQLYLGRGFALQGDAGQLVGTPLRISSGRVNHCVYVNAGRGWHKDANGHVIPSEVLVYDPGADGKRTTWGTRYHGPAWWPWLLALQFAAQLHIYGEGDERTLGAGAFYAALFPSTEPHVHLKHGAHRTDPFPDHTTAYHPRKGRTVPVRSGPGTEYPVVRRLATGTSFLAYQSVEATPGAEGERTWKGDHNGELWVVASRLRGKGGTS